MSLMSFILIVSLLFILFNCGETIQCPNSLPYNDIGRGCYKIVTGFSRTWSDAREDCRNDSFTLSNNETTHLVALENVMEKTALFYWLAAYQMKIDFWTDGILSTSSWNWSNQSIVWYFNSTERAIIGNGSNYKLAYNQNGTNYQISDDIGSHTINYICEYQILCDEPNDCQNNASCYSNVGEDVCICAPGFTGDYCEIEIDECLSSPCLHGGNCTNGINSYTCDCSNIFYDGSNCQTPKADPTYSERSTAFWSVLGFVTGLVVLLTLSDLPWEDILTAIGCSCYCLRGCSNKNDVEHINENDLRLSDSPTNNHNYGTTRMSMLDGTLTPQGTNYHVMSTVWDPEYKHNQTPITPQYNGYRSPDQNIIPNDSHAQTFAAVVMAKQNQKQFEDNRIYAVNINEPKSKTKDPVDTMVNWTQQLQEQLRNKKARETSASSTKQLIHSSDANDY